ncbi:hypothetical protein [Chromohalobacter israelensis]|uniref:hypothetical protein n=1 Tax=Chromohalobacter israelensis TaxID=141390 RepID=UPI0032E8DBBE
MTYIYIFVTLAYKVLIKKFNTREGIMAKKVYLHIGAHKSASKTIQRNIAKNSEFFKQVNGISHIMSQDLNGSDFARHFTEISGHRLPSDSFDFDESIELARLFIEDLINSTATEDVLLSWEGILGSSALDKYEGIYTHSSIVSKSLAYIFRSYPVRILMVTRQQDTFIESCYLQQIKEGRCLSFDEFVENIDVNKLSWKVIADDLNRAFRKKLCVVPFEFIKVLGTGQFLNKTLSYLFEREIKIDGINLIDQANGSMSNYGVEMARALYPHLSDQGLSEARQMIFREFNSEKFGKARFFNKFSRSLIRQITEKENAEMYKKYTRNFYSFAGVSSAPYV